MTAWQRLEGLCRSEELSGGLEARTADPMWLLARQWQVGELRGDDAARPVAVSVSTRSLPLTTVGKGMDRVPTPLPTSVPLEYLVERIGEPTTGEAGLYSAARLGHRLSRLLAQAKLATARSVLIGEFPIVEASTPLASTGLMAETAALLARRSPDGHLILRRSDDQLRTVLRGALSAAQIEATIAVVARWRAWCAASGANVTGDAWVEERLEYDFTVTAQDHAAALEFHAAEHTGGDIDWFSFDLTSRPLPEGAPSPPTSIPGGRPPPVGELGTVTSLPSPVQYRGQPAQRWWEFEDRTTNFADIDAGPADLARLLVTEFAVAFSNDWFVVPARVAVGSATEVLQMAVVDNFGGMVDVESAAAHDDGPKGTSARSWRMFEIAGDELTDRHRSPWLLVPPTVVGDLAGAPLERVSFVRDEGANLVWGIERLVEGPAGRSLDRSTVAPRPAPVPVGAPPVDATETIGYDEQVWRYRLESKVPPPFWIPFLPERVSSNSEQIRLRRSRMQQWETSDVAAPGPHGMVLDGRRPCWIREEEVPRSGVRVDRRWRYARGHDGIGRVWLQLEKSPGNGERSSGVRWDIIDRTTP